MRECGISRLKLSGIEVELEPKFFKFDDTVEEITEPQNQKPDIDGLTPEMQQALYGRTYGGQ